MTQKEAIQRINKACKEYDTEMAHSEADDILIEFLAANGFEALSEKFNEEARHFWYA